MGSSLKYRAGLCLIVAVVLIWVLSAEVTQVRCGFCNLFAFSSVYLFILIGLEVLGSWLGMHACLSDWFGSFRFGRKCSVLIRLFLLNRTALGGFVLHLDSFLNVTRRVENFSGECYASVVISVLKEHLASF